jgi:hypothetical protein
VTQAGFVTFIAMRTSTIGCERDYYAGVAELYIHEVLYRKDLWALYNVVIVDGSIDTGHNIDHLNSLYFGITLLISGSKAEAKSEDIAVNLSLSSDSDVDL